MRRLAIIVTHPIQYYAPVFKLLHLTAGVALKVFYTAGAPGAGKYDHGFKQQVVWDLPLLDGYPYEWVPNAAQHPGSHHFNGIVNPDIIAKITAFDPDALLVYGWSYRAHLQVLRHFKGKLPVLFRGDSTLLDQQSFLRTVIRGLLLRWVYRHVDHAFYTGINSKRYFLAYGLRERQLSFAPHAIDNERFLLSRAGESKQLRETLSIGNESVLILFAGKFESKKDPHLLLEAFLQLRANAAHLLFVGNGELEPSLKAAAGQAVNVHFLGFQNQTVMPVIYQSCDLFCLPSRGPGETWGLAVNEAMASGKPVLVSNKVGCATDLVQQGQTGMVFSADSLADLHAKLQELVEKGRDELGLMGGLSRERIQIFSFENQTKAIINIVKNG